MRAAVKIIIVAFALIWAVVKGFHHVFGPDRQVLAIESDFVPGASSRELHDLLETKGFDVYRHSNGYKWIVTGGQRLHGFEATVFAVMVPDLNATCEADGCEVFFAEKTEKPFGDGSKWSHDYRIAWLANADSIAEVSGKNRVFFYPLK